ncbi:MAG: Crp/Fnr family transcriptional regulator [Betaproteobacteria bacterium]|nr:Crp/Fnr family transcriptional regulator [Betaproteobacteria bacterium]
MKSVEDRLGDFDAFSDLSPTGRGLLTQGIVARNAKRATAILHKGQPVSGAYFVLEGRLRIYTISPNGTEATLYFVDPGEACVLALNCLFNDLLYPAWVQAESPAVVAIIPGPVYKKLFETERAIQDLTVKALSTLVYRLMNELEQVHASNQKQRLAQFLLLHSAADGVLRMTQQQIARHLGTTREVIARLIRELVALHLVSTERGAIRIRDLFGLRRIVVPVSAAR